MAKQLREKAKAQPKNNQTKLKSEESRGRVRNGPAYFYAYFYP
jgi:hypothetical protein